MWIDVFFEEWALILERSLFHGIAKKVSKKIAKKIAKKILKKEILASESGPRMFLSVTVESSTTPQILGQNNN